MENKIVLKIEFDIHLDDTDKVNLDHINDEIFREGVQQVRQMFEDYYKLGIMPRIGEKFIAGGPGSKIDKNYGVDCDVLFEIVNIIFTNWKIMIQIEPTFDD